MDRTRSSMAARTPGAAKMDEGNAFMKFTMKLYYKFMGKDVSEIVEIIEKDVQSTKEAKLTAYKLEAPVDLSLEMFDKENEKKLDEETRQMLEKYL